MSELTDFTVPMPVLYSREAEEAVLGAVLINPNIFYSVSVSLRADDFFIHRHRFIWEAFTRLNDQHISLDFLTVAEELERKGQLDEVGGPAYVTSLTTAVPTSLHAEAYANVVVAFSGRRHLLTTANQIARLACQTDSAFETTLSEAEKMLFAVTQPRSGSNLRHIARVVGGVYDQVAELAERPEDVQGIPTGFIDLDKLLIGLQPSDLVLVAGRPGMGKTSLLLSLLLSASQASHQSVAIFTLEMSGEQLVLRLLSQVSGIDSQRLRSGRLTDDEWSLFAAAADKLSQLPVYLDDTPALTPFQLRSACRRLAMEHGLDLVIVDYLQLMSGGGTKEQRFENRVQEVGHISRQLKILAKELNIPVIAAAQLSRAVEQRADKKPTLADLRESGSLEMDADIVLLLHRPQPGLNVVSLEVAKNRKGPVGVIDLVYRPELTRFENAQTLDLKEIY